MPRLGFVILVLLGALALAVASTQAPAPRSAAAPRDQFSAERAMFDIRHMARAPHPVGTAEHERVRAYLFNRMSQLGLSPEIQPGVLSPESTRRLEQWSAGEIVGYARLYNLVGVLPGRDPSLPAVMLMAHYDSGWGSPGAADDSTGVAAILETVRALRLEGQAERDLVVLITDAEELNLDGARAFFSEHPRRDRIGLIVNLEARGGGGRAMMFETGPGNAQTIALFARATRGVDGGVTSNSLAALVYENMPNGTDYTVPKARGVAGLNLAFIGRPAQYHSPTSTPDALDRGAVQHIGAQTLAIARQALAAPALPQATTNAVFADVMGLFLVRYGPGLGWVLMGLTLAAAGGAAWLWRRDLGLRRIGLGAVEALWAVALGVVTAQLLRGVAGPMGDRYGAGPDLYYTLLRRLPWIEAGVALGLAAVLILALASPPNRLRATLLVLVLALVAGGLSLVTIVAGALAAALSFVRPPRAPREAALGWIGLALLLGLAVQLVAPTAGFLLHWPALAASLGLLAWAALTPRLGDLRSAALAAVVFLPVAGWLLYQAHPTFLGVGMDLPGVAAVFMLLIGLGVRAFAPPAPSRPLMVAAALCLALGLGLSGGARLAEPAPPPQAGGPS